MYKYTCTLCLYTLPHVHVYTCISKLNWFLLTCLSGPDLLVKLEAEGVALKAARGRAEKAEAHVSMTMLDLKSSREEVAHLQSEMATLKQKVGGRLVARQLILPVCIYTHVPPSPLLPSPPLPSPPLPSPPHPSPHGSCMLCRLRVAVGYRASQTQRKTMRRGSRNFRLNHYIIIMLKIATTSILKIASTSCSVVYSDIVLQLVQSHDIT